ncbi:MAG: hypothetical protein OEY56_07070 [Cyclobacteriaceae bacterium]|nr:hypothetical protein [Cyclobacteriaceae bacterium]
MGLKWQQPDQIAPIVAGTLVLCGERASRVIKCLAVSLQTRI